MELALEPAGQADAGVVAAIVAALLAELAPEVAPDVSALTRTATEVLAMPTVSGVIARHGNQPAGLIMLNDCAAIYAGGRFGEITELFVRPDLRSRGVAGALIAEARRIGRERGWARIEVGAPEQPLWARTLGFYRRAGFEEVGPRLRLRL